MSLGRVLQNKLNIFLSKLMERAVFLNLGSEKGIKNAPQLG